MNLSQDIPASAEMCEKLEQFQKCIWNDKRWTGAGELTSDIYETYILMTRKSLRWSLSEVFLKSYLKRCLRGAKVLHEEILFLGSTLIILRFLLRRWSSIDEASDVLVHSGPIYLNFKGDIQSSEPVKDSSSRFRQLWSFLVLKLPSRTWKCSLNELRLLFFDGNQRK